MLKSPELIVDALLWIEGIVTKKDTSETARSALINALSRGESSDDSLMAISDTVLPMGIGELTAKYEYAYWLGYIYRYESLLHEEASRMVYAVLEEPFMRKTFAQMDFGDINLSDCAREICQRLDQLILCNL